MLDQRIADAKRLFMKKRGLLERCKAKDNLSITISDKNLKSVLIKQYDKQKNTAGFSGYLNSDAALFVDRDKFLSINKFLSDFQGNINYLISRILNEEGQYANASSQGIGLGNGRQVMSVGVWFSYAANVYNCKEEDAFYDLMSEEIGILMAAMPIIHGVSAYLIEENPTIHEVDSMYPTKAKVELARSPFVGKFINHIETKKGIDANKKANSILTRGYDSSMADIKLSSVDDVFRLIDEVEKDD